MNNKKFYETYGHALNNDEKKSLKIMMDVFDYRCSEGKEKKEVAKYLYAVESEKVESVALGILFVLTSLAVIVLMTCYLPINSLTTALKLFLLVIPAFAAYKLYKQYKQFIFDAADYQYFNFAVTRVGLPTAKQLYNKHIGLKWH